MLYRFPRARVLALSGDARRAFLYELRPHRTPLGELSREACWPPCAPRRPGRQQ